MAETSFTGKTVVITGAGSGLGFGMARRFAQTGAHAVIAEIDPARGEKATVSLRAEGLSASFEPLDVRESGQSAALVNKLVGERGQIDVWVNNAGVAHRGPAETLDDEEWDDSLAVMLSGAFYCAQAVGRHMLERGKGVIVNVSSMYGLQPVENRVAYSVAKGGLVTLTQALGIEWAKRGVRVVGIAAGVIMAGMVERSINSSKSLQSTLERRTPLHRLGTVEEIAEAVLYLASDQASYITGETMRVDGGWTAYQLF